MKQKESKSDGHPGLKGPFAEKKSRIVASRETEFELTGSVDGSQAASLAPGRSHENGAVLKEHVLGAARFMGLP